MDKQSTIKEYIEGALQTSRFAVLATVGEGQPHTSLIAITPFGSSGQLVFATYRNTLKYRNLTHNSKVSVLIESRDINNKGPHKSIVLTIVGHTEEISIAENEAIYEAHLKRHPEMESFMLSSDCVIIRIIARAYQLVNGIDDIRWVTTEYLDTI